MAQHPYSFSNPVDPATTRSRRRSLQLEDERRAAAWDSEAPATAQDSDLERKESRTPLYIAGAASVVILGGLLLLASAAAGDPPLAATVETETIPRHAALVEKLDAEALDRARITALGGTLTLGGALTPAAPPAPVEIEATSNERAHPEEEESGAVPMSGDPSSSDLSSARPMSVDPSVEPQTAPSRATDDCSRMATNTGVSVCSIRGAACS